MKATILKIIRLGLQGDKDSMKSYVELLANEYETTGDKKFAERLRKYANEDFGNIIVPMSACPFNHDGCQNCASCVHCGCEWEKENLSVQI